MLGWLLYRVSVHFKWQGAIHRHLYEDKEESIKGNEWGPLWTWYWPMEHNLILIDIRRTFELSFIITQPLDRTTRGTGGGIFSNANGNRNNNHIERWQTLTSISQTLVTVCNPIKLKTLQTLSRYAGGSSSSACRRPWAGTVPNLICKLWEAAPILLKCRCSLVHPDTNKVPVSLVKLYKTNYHSME